MTVIVIGGQSRNIGKTSVMSALIKAFVEKQWTVIKLTQHGHGICSLNGNQCDCAGDDHLFNVLEENDLSGRSDTSRFRLSGASRALWIRVKQGHLSSFMPQMKAILESQPFVMIESNSILEYFKPDLFLSVLKYDIADFKESARQMLSYCDGVVKIQSEVHVPVWKELFDRIAPGTPVFEVTPPDYISTDLINFVHDRL